VFSTVPDFRSRHAERSSSEVVEMLVYQFTRFIGLKQCLADLLFY